VLQSAAVCAPRVPLRQAPLRPGRLREAIQRYPSASAVLVRRHGVYVWGRDWIHAKTQAECYDYQFEAALRMAAMGVDAARPPPPPPLANGHAALASAARAFASWCMVLSRWAAA